MTIFSAISLLVLIVIGTLMGFWVIALLLRLGSLRRLSGLLTAPVATGSRDGEHFALAGVEGSARSLVRLVCTESGCHFALLLLPRQGDDRLTVAAADGDSHSYEMAELSFFHPLVRRLSSSGETAEILEPDDDVGLPVHSLLFPILSRGRLIGVLAIGPRSDRRPVGQRSRATIATAASQATAPLENAQLYSSLRRAFSDLEDAQRELLALQRVSVAAQSTLRLDEALVQMSLGVVDGLSFDTATVYLVDTQARTLSMPVGKGGAGPHASSPEPVPFDESNPSIQSLLANEVLITRDIRESIVPRLIEAGALTTRAVQPDSTVVNLPLAAKDGVIGGMALTTRRAAVSEREIESLRTFAAQAAATIENARLYGALERAYSDLRTAQEQLIRAERLRTLGQVASGVAHDFNNILAAILTRTQLAQQQTRSAAMRETLEVIEQAALDGASITRRIQSLARPRAERATEAVDLNEIVRQAVELTQPMWLHAAQAHGNTIAAKSSLEAVTPVQGQASELREVFTNLILNATSAMPAGGMLRIHTYERDGIAWCAVQDTGTGMTEEVRRRMFDPFFTTKGAAGSGLGMSIVASILERHAGRIEVESQLGLGTTVRVGLPLARAQIAAPKTRRRRGHVSLRLLIVEEDARTRDALSLILSRLGHHVCTAAGAEEAIRMIVNEETDVVITDLSLGEHTGWEVAETAKSVRPDAAVVLVTAWNNQWEPEEARARGVDAILAKPFTVDQVLACLEQALVGSA